MRFVLLHEAYLPVVWLQRSMKMAPRNLSLVRFDFDSVPRDYHDKYPFQPDRVYIIFGEIPNMPGHCIVADHKTGQLSSGYHIENFLELDGDET